MTLFYSHRNILLKLRCQGAEYMEGHKDMYPREDAHTERSDLPNQSME